MKPSMKCISIPPNHLGNSLSSLKFLTTLERPQVLNWPLLEFFDTKIFGPIWIILVFAVVVLFDLCLGV